MNPNELDPMSRVRLGALYDRLARLLPLEGRDYAVRITKQDNDIKFALVGITPFGRTWVEYCSAQMAPQPKESNDGVAGKDAGKAAATVHPA